MAKPRKSRSSEPAASPLGPPIAFDPAAVDALLGGRQSMAELDELFRQMKKALMERALSGELTHHLGYGRGDPKPAEQTNHRNGSTPKTVLTEDGAIPLATPVIATARSRGAWRRRMRGACPSSINTRGRSMRTG